MNPFYRLKNKAKLEIYLYIDKNIRKLPKDKDGNFDEFQVGYWNNDVDALRHAYVSAIYTYEYNEKIADYLGRANELFGNSSGKDGQSEENMDLWNNAVGRKIGRGSKSKKTILQKVIKAFENGELIIHPKDTRTFKGPQKYQRLPKNKVVVIKESKTGENLEFLDLRSRVSYSLEEFVKAIQSGLFPRYSVKKIKGKQVPVSKRDGKKINNLDEIKPRLAWEDQRVSFSAPINHLHFVSSSRTQGLYQVRQIVLVP
jgi:hypothetical protein